ncbi:hypothetical protein [Marispirochaeta sp.]|uniref:hypothetical protein n=1 Tax=Marispirochaeta sp. TaxID=2038653 RepID=UPI0029C9AB66|nr:hypothetical protein [Marispirochaeta sp.]
MWKKDWDQLQQHFTEFWQRKGFILSTWNSSFQTERITCPDPENVLPDINSIMRFIEEKDRWDQFYLNPELVAQQQRDALCRALYPGDLMPFAYCDWGTISLAPMLGAEQHFGKETVWYTHKNAPVSPDNDRPLVLKEDDQWYRMLRELARIGTARAEGKYHCGFPAVCGGLDVLAELRGASELCMDLVLEPDWVKEKLREIDQASREAYLSLYDIMRADGGSMFHAFFMVWGRGKTSLIQCDFAALISEEMFREFAVPSIRDACSCLDYSLYHVDGPEAVRTVDALLEIDEIDCIEFTPGPKVPQGGDPKWYPLYRKIKDSGKCVQAVEMQASEVVPLLEALGPEGMYLMVNFQSERELYDTLEAVERFR